MPPACVFCAIARGDLDSELVAFRDAHTVVVPSLHQRPQNLGHMLVLPAAHVPFIYDVDAVVGAALMRTLSAVARAVKHAASAHGISVRQNNEQHGGQDVFHVHFHVIPRFEHDGFNDGDDRFPYGIVEVDRDVRRTQADRMRGALGHPATT
jgi:diadenosine tetraphosphate (Ap4A) HIT family hydrolase